jgi:hypothetical protein
MIRTIPSRIITLFASCILWEHKETKFQCNRHAWLYLLQAWKKTSLVFSYLQNKLYLASGVRCSWLPINRLLDFINWHLIYMVCQHMLTENCFKCFNSAGYPKTGQLGSGINKTKQNKLQICRLCSNLSAGTSWFLEVFPTSTSIGSFPELWRVRSF